MKSKPQNHPRTRKRTADDVTDAGIKRQIQRTTYYAICRILEAGCNEHELRRLRAQRKKLEPRLAFLRDKS